MDYDLSDLKSKFRKVETQINGTNYYMISVDVYNNLEQYIQTKIDQEVKKRDEKWIQALEKRNKAILS